MISAIFAGLALAFGFAGLLEYARKQQPRRDVQRLVMYVQWVVHQAAPPLVQRITTTGDNLTSSMWVYSPGQWQKVEDEPREVNEPRYPDERA